MPRVKLGISQVQLEIEADLRGRYGGMMTATDVGRELGVSDHHCWDRWLADVPAVVVNERKRWRVADIAKKMFSCMEVAV